MSMLILWAHLLLFGLIESLNLTVVDYGERMEVSLQKYFNHSLQYPEFSINRNQSDPYNIDDYFSFQFLKKFYQITSVEMSHNGFNLSEHKIYQTLSVRTQPLKLFLTEETLMMVLYDDQLKDKSILLSTLNLSKSTNKTLSCKECTFDTENYRFYVQCTDTVRNQPITALVNLQRDTNHIVNAMIYIRSLNTAGNLTQCDQSKALYLNDVFVGTRYVQKEVLLYCPYSKNRADTFTAISFDASLEGNLTIYNYTFKDCPKNCCYGAETIMYLDREQLLMLTNSTMFGYKSNICIPIVNYEDFISLRVGSIIQDKDVYILSREYLHIKYPKLTNVETINITEPDMTPIAFTITHNYIIVQLVNATDERSILKVYKIVNYNPKLLDIVKIDYSEVLFGTQNYLEAADYMYLFTQATNKLGTAYYQGLQLTLDPIGNFSHRSQFKIAIVNSNNETQKVNETLDIYITVYSFNSSEYIVDYSQLSYIFEESFIKIPLRDGVIGPLVEFYTFDQISLDKEFLNGIYLIDIQKALNYQNSFKNILGLMLERQKDQSDLLRIKFALKGYKNNQVQMLGEGQYIFLYDCSLQYRISVFEIEKCNNLTTRMINQSLIKLEDLKGFFYIQNLNKNWDEYQYLLYDTDFIMLCNDTFCQEKTRPGLPLKTKSINVINTAKGPLIMRLRNDSKSLSLFSLNDINNPQIVQLMEINNTKLVDLNQDSVVITDYYTDLQFQQLMIIQLNNSKVYIMQKQYNNLGNILCHATSLIHLSNVTVCSRFQRTFFITENSPAKIVILCSQNKTIYHLVEFKIYNPFDVQKSRQYPIYDYTINPNSSLHFSDDQFIYIAATRDGPCYLVYNPLQITPNVLMYKIPAFQNYHLEGDIQNQIKRKGYGLIDKWAFVVSDSYYQGQIDLNKYKDNISKDTASFAVRNDRDQLSLVEFQIIIDLTKSNLNYPLETSKYMLESATTNLNFSLNISQLSGPVSTADIKSSCDYWPQILKTQILENSFCVRNDQDISLGKLLSYAPLRSAELVVTTERILCIQNRSIVNHRLQNNTNCTLKDFSSSTQQQALIYCQWDVYYSFTLRIIKVSDQCQVQIKDTFRPSNLNYFSIMAEYPRILVEIPILLPENKNYYTCLFDEETLTFGACAMLVNVLQNNFLSLDSDIHKGFGLILEKGVGIYNLSQRQNKIDALGWISEEKLISMGIRPPYKYARILKASQNGRQFTLELANQAIAFELSYDLLDARILRIYQQYIDCSNINVKSLDIDKYKVKICEYLKSQVEILDETVPIQSYSDKLIQLYLKQSYENYPVGMFCVENTSSFYISQNRLLQTTQELEVCYYDLHDNISWVLSFDGSKLQEGQDCQHHLQIKNNHYLKQFNITFEVEKDPPQAVLSLYLSHIPFVLLLVAFPFIKMWGKKQKKRPDTHLVSRKKSYKKNFYSNDFEDKLKTISNQSIMQSKL